MITGNKGLSLIKEYESCELLAYPDPASELGKVCESRKLKLVDYSRVQGWQALKADPVTIGWGHTGKHLKLGDSITQDTADSLLRLDVQYAEYWVHGFLGLNQNQFDALASLAYNCPAALKPGTGLRRYLSDQNFAAAADEFLKWHYAGGKPMAGLMRRRAAERELFLTPVAEGAA